MRVTFFGGGGDKFYTNRTATLKIRNLLFLRHYIGANPQLTNQRKYMTSKRKDCLPI